MLQQQKYIDSANNKFILMQLMINNKIKLASSLLSKEWKTAYFLFWIQCYSTTYVMIKQRSTDANGTKNDDVKYRSCVIVHTIAILYLHIANSLIVYDVLYICNYLLVECSYVSIQPLLMTGD